MIGIMRMAEPGIGGAAMAKMMHSTRSLTTASMGIGMPAALHMIHQRMKASTATPLGMYMIIPSGKAKSTSFPSRRLIPTAAIQAPVLLIAGSRDPYVSPALCREAFGTLQNPASQLAIIEGGEHAMLMEKPYYRIFRERVLAFLRE